MQHLPPKDSLYAIEPWNDEPTVIPNSFLATHQFAKTAFLPSSSLKSSQHLQIATNSVYLIKNLPDSDGSTVKKRLRFHCTAQNSPRLAAQMEEKRSMKRGLSDRLTKSHQMMKSYKKRPLDDDPVLSKFQETKQTFIEFKVIKRSRRPSQEGIEHKNSESKSNLQKKYERSTLSKDLKKKEGRLQEGHEQICIRRKLKTEKSKPDSVKNLVSYTEDPENQIQQTLPLKLNPQVSAKQSLMAKDDSCDKLRFELMMERKLFLMKSNLSKWHKNIENYSIGANRKSK